MESLEGIEPCCSLWLLWISFIKAVQELTFWRDSFSYSEPRSCNQSIPLVLIIIQAISCWKEVVSNDKSANWSLNSRKDWMDSFFYENLYSPQLISLSSTPLLKSNSSRIESLVIIADIIGLNYCTSCRVGCVAAWEYWLFTIRFSKTDVNTFLITELFL